MRSHGYNNLQRDRPPLHSVKMKVDKMGERAEKREDNSWRIKAVYRGADEWHCLSPREATNYNDIR